MPTVSHDVPQGVARLLLDTDKYAQNGVRPPIRTNRNSLFKRGMESLRPSHLGKFNRLMFREKAMEKIKHYKAANIGTPAGTAAVYASDVGIKVLVGIGTGLTTIASAGLSVGLGAVYIGLKYLYDNEKKGLRRLKVEYYSLPSSNEPKKVMHALAQLLSNGELGALAHKAQKALVGQQKYANESRKWSSISAGTKTCGDAVLLSWRYLYFQKRLFESLQESKALAELLRFGKLASEAFEEVADGINATGERITKWWIRNSKAVRSGKRSPVQLEDDGMMRWKTWYNHSNATRLGDYVKRGRASSKKEKLLNQFGEFCKATGYTGGVLGAKGAKNFAYAIMKLGVARGTYAIGSNGIGSMMLKSTTKPPPSLNVAHGGVNCLAGAAVNLLITYAAQWWNDKNNMKQFMGESNGTHLSYEKRIWLLRSILEHGRIQGLYKCYSKMTDALAKANTLFDENRTDGKKMDAALSKIIGQLYTAYAELAKGLALMVWVNRMLMEVGVAYTDMADYYEDELVNMKQYLATQFESSHMHCKGTCYAEDEPNDPIAPL